jgi:ACR3 family arsenite transporter
MFFSVLFVLKKVGVRYDRTTAQAFTGASNNFELAIAVAISIYGADSPQALAATVGPLVEYVHYIFVSVINSELQQYTDKFWY